MRLGLGGLTQMGVRQTGGVDREVVLGIGRCIVNFVTEIPQSLPLVFFQQAIVVILRVALEIHNAKLIGADRHVHPCLVAVHQNPQPGRRQLLVGDLVPARMRHVEPCVDALQQRVQAIGYPVAVDSPLLARQLVPVNLIQLLHQGMRRQTRTKYAGDVIRCPIDHFPQRRPERLQFQGRLRDIGAGNDQRVQARLSKVFKLSVVRVNVGGRVRTARQAGNRKRVDVELRDLVAVADKPHVLLLSNGKRGIGHHVQQADMKFSNVLRHGPIEGQDVVADSAQSVESGQVGVRHEGHAGLLRWAPQSGRYGPIRNCRGV